MTFKWKISHAPLECEFETGSIGEAIEILSNESSQLAQVFGLGAVSIGVGDPPSQATAAEGDSTTAPASATAEAPRRGRKPKNQPDPSTASAPPPAPVPDAPAAPPPAPPAPATALAPPAPSVDGLALPAFLDRSNPGNVATGDGSAAPAVASPPPMPASPPIAPPAPAVPPVGVLGPKMVDAITKQKQGDGAVWVKWLADSGLVVPGATFDEAMDCLRFTADGKLAAAAAQLQIA